MDWCSPLGNHSRWLSNFFVDSGFKYFQYVLHPLEAHGRLLLLERARVTIPSGLNVLTLRPATHKRLYCTNSKTVVPLSIDELRSNVGILPLINPEWLRGFVDGEGSFYIDLRRNLSGKAGYRVELSFFIKQSSRSASSLFAIREFFGKGNIRFNDSNKENLRFEIKSHEAAFQIIVPFFEKYPLLTSKQLNFLDFKRVAVMVQEGRHLTEEGILEIQRIKSGMNSRRTYASKLEYMESRSGNILITPGWLSGFIDGEGHLGVHISKGGPKLRCEPKFSIAQNAHDEAVLEAIAEYFKTSNKIVGNTGRDSSVKQLNIYNFDTLANQIVPLLDKYPLLTAKQDDFIVWKTVLEMIGNKEHLTSEGFEKISKLVSKDRS